MTHLTCDHVLGASVEDNCVRLILKSYKPHKWEFDIEFKFCPECGYKLTREECL